MRFCDACNNMLYIKVEDASTLLYFCKNCQAVFPEDTSESRCVTENVLDEDVSNYKQYITPYIKFDKTLPKVNNVMCPNQGCTRGKKDNEVMYIKFNATSMSYLYYCCHCEHFWKSGTK